jgi:hypothetical protein
MLQASVVKERTKMLFGMQLLPADEIERKMEICVACPQHTRRSVCWDCTGLGDWVLRGFGGRRGRLPADRATGVCLADGVLTAASASVVARPRLADTEYPSGCWRLKEAI